MNSEITGSIAPPPAERLMLSRHEALCAVGCMRQDMLAAALATDAAFFDYR